MKAVVIAVLIIASFGPRMIGPASMDIGVSAENAVPDPTQQRADRQALDEEKLRQEIRKLELENQKLGGWRDFVSSNAGFITAIVAVLGVIITIWKQMDENKSRRKQFEVARQQDLERHERERKQRLEAIAEERKRRMEANLASVVEKLGSPDPQVQDSAALSILSFLRPEFEAQVFLILLSTFRLPQSDRAHGILISGFEKLVRNLVGKRAAALQDDQAEMPDWNFSRTNLKRVNLSKLGLQETDWAFADLRSSNLSGANLFRAKGWKVNFENARLSGAVLQEARLMKAKLRNAHLHGAVLISANLKKADLRGARLQRARLQSAHLDKAVLLGAGFHDANLNDTFFLGAKFDDASLQSILKARHWERAHFDATVKEKLNGLQPSGTTKPAITAPGSS